MIAAQAPDAPLIGIDAILWSVEYQQLMFSDGKYFDEHKATLTLDGGSTIAIKVDVIIRREPADSGKKALGIPPPVKTPGDEFSRHRLA